MRELLLKNIKNILGLNSLFVVSKNWKVNISQKNNIWDKREWKNTWIGLNI